MNLYAVLEYQEVIWPSLAYSMVVEVYSLVVYFAPTSTAYFALASKAYFALAASKVYFAPEVVRPQNLLVRDANLEVMLMPIHYENYWTVDVDGKTSVEVAVAVVDVQVSSNAVAAAAAVAAFAVVVESFVGTYFDYFHKLYTLQRKTNKDSSNEREFDILKKVPTYRDFVAVVALLHEKLGFAAGSSAASSADTREVQHHPQVPQEPRGRGGHKGCSTFEQKFLFIMILPLLSSTESMVRARQRC